MQSAQDYDLEDLLALLRHYLGQYGGTHERAQSSAYLENDRKPDGTLGGGGLEGGDEKVIRHESARVTEAYRETFRKALEAGKPLHKIVLNFRKTPEGWACEPKLQSSKEAKAIKKARAALDARIADELVRLAGDSWDSVSLDVRNDTGAPPKVKRRLGRDIKELALSDLIVSSLKEAEQLYASHGWDVITANWRVKGKAEDRELDCRVFYL